LTTNCIFNLHILTSDNTSFLLKQLKILHSKDMITALMSASMQVHL